MDAERIDEELAAIVAEHEGAELGRVKLVAIERARNRIGNQRRGTERLVETLEALGGMDRDALHLPVFDLGRRIQAARDLAEVKTDSKSGSVASILAVESGQPLMNR